MKGSHSQSPRFPAEGQDRMDKKDQEGRATAEAEHYAGRTDRWRELWEWTLSEGYGACGQALAGCSSPPPSLRQELQAERRGAGLRTFSTVAEHPDHHDHCPGLRRNRLFRSSSRIWGCKTLRRDVSSAAVCSALADSSWPGGGGWGSDQALRETDPWQRIGFEV